MALAVSTQERPSTHYVGLPVSARFSEFGAPDGPNEMVPRIYQWLGEHDVDPLGGPLYIYRHLGESRAQTVDLTVGVPVAEPVAPSSGLVLGRLPAGVYVVGRHVGSPDTIAAARAEVDEWAQAHGHRLPTTREDDGMRWTGFAEHFLTNPAEEPDRSKWVTELLFKIG